MPFMAPGDAHRVGDVGSGERAPWLPSELRTSVGGEPPAPPAPAAPAPAAPAPEAPAPEAEEPLTPGADPGANGTDASREPETRPSEWGRAVFDPEPSDPPEG